MADKGIVHQPKPLAFLMTLPWALVLDSYSIWVRAGREGRSNDGEVNGIIDLVMLFEGNVSNVQFILGIYAVDLHIVFNFSVLKQWAKL